MFARKLIVNKRLSVFQKRKFMCINFFFTILFEDKFSCVAFVAGN